MMLGFHLYVSGDEKWNRPFDMVRDGENTFTWTHTGIAEHLRANGRGLLKAASEKTPRSGHSDWPELASV